ncbi:hypothetical protein JCM11251_004195 [Rhodosporidiobolus azoricus]
MPFLIAFKSLEDAQRTIDYSQQKQLPNVEGMCNWLTLSFAAPWPPSPPAPIPPSDLSISTIAAQPTTTTAVQPPQPTLSRAERDTQLRKAVDAELALAWKWGELSHEVRATWQTRRELPTSKRCPPRDVRCEGDDWNISEEYDEEPVRILTPRVPSVRQAVQRRSEIAKEKKAIYEERCAVYNAWADKVDPKNVDPNDPSRPAIPTYPFDEVALKRIEARRKAEEEAESARRLQAWEAKLEAERVRQRQEAERDAERVA